MKKFFDTRIRTIRCGLVILISAILICGVYGEERNDSIINYMDGSTNPHLSDYSLNIEDFSPVIINQIDNSSFRNISAYVSVLDPNGTPVGGLTKSNFTVTEDQTCQPEFNVMQLTPNQSSISFAMLTDYSGSMFNDYTNSTQALKDFINLTANDDKNSCGSIQ